MDMRIIKTDEHYQEALAQVARLAERDPALASPNGVRLELLVKLVEDYEKRCFTFNEPHPIDAIVFRMEEMG